MGRLTLMFRLFASLGMAMMAIVSGVVLVGATASPRNIDHGTAAATEVREPAPQAGGEQTRKNATPLMEKNQRQSLEGIHFDFPVSDQHVDLLDEVRRTDKDGGWYTAGGIGFEDLRQQSHAV